MSHPEGMKIRDVVTVDVSSITMKQGTYMQIRIPTPECTPSNPIYHILEVLVSDAKVVSIHATPGTPQIEIWED